MDRTRRRAQTGLILAGGVVVVAGVVVGLVEMYRLPKASIWIVVGIAVLLVVAIRMLTTRT